MLNRIIDSRLIVAIDLECFKSKAIEFGRKVSQSKHIVSCAHRLKAVLVDNHHEVIQAVMGRHKRSFPDGPFVELTITDDCVHLLVRVLALESQSNANTYGEAMAQGSRSDLQTRHP